MAGTKGEGLKPNTGCQQVLLLICLGWSVHCIPSAELAKTNLAIEHQVQPPDCHFWPMCSIPSQHTDHYFWSEDGID